MKNQSLSSSFFPEIKNLRLNLLLDNACWPFFEAREASFSSSMRSKVWNQLQDLCKDPKEVETVSSMCWEKKLLFFYCDNTRPHTKAATSVAIEGIGLEVIPNPHCGLDLALPDFWLFAGVKEYLTEFVSHVMKKLKGFHEQPEEFYNRGLEKLIQCWWHIRQEGYYVKLWSLKTKYPLWAMFYVLFHFDTSFGSKDTNMEALVSECPFSWLKIEYCVKLSSAVSWRKLKVVCLVCADAVLTVSKHFVSWYLCFWIHIADTEIYLTYAMY